MNTHPAALAALGLRPLISLLNGTCDPALVPARVTRIDHARAEVLSPAGPAVVHVPRRLCTPPLVVGDGVLLDEDASQVVRRLPRRTTLCRAAAGRSTERQVIAANVDRVFVVMGLDGDFSPRRLERYLALCADADVDVVVLLTKAAAADDVEAKVAACGAVATYDRVVAVAAIDVIDGVAPELPRQHIEQGMTVALLGSSGAGKSTLVNHLLGRQRMATRDVRARDDRGCHTTTHRELVPLPGGGLLVDNPGMRELALWLDGDGLDRAFDDIERLAAECHFSDCHHDGEPGCAIEAALDDGRLAYDRLESYVRLQREVAAQARRRNQKEKREHERAFAQHCRAVMKASRRRKGN